MQELEKFKQVMKDQKDSFYQFSTNYLDKPAQRYRDIRLNRSNNSGTQTRVDVLLRFQEHIAYLQDLIDQDEKQLCQEIRDHYNGVFYLPYEGLKFIPESVTVRKIDNEVVEERERLVQYEMSGDDDWKAALAQERKAGRYMK